MTRPALRLAALLLAVLVGAGQPTDPDRAGVPRDQMVAAVYVPFWEDRAVASLRRATTMGGATEISPIWAVVRADGGLRLIPPSRAVREAAGGARLLPTVQNYDDEQWQGQRTAELLADPARAEEHRRLLVRTALRFGWDGIDIDYEDLPPTAGPAFTRFLADLADDLHAHDLLLSVAVPARTSDEDPWGLAYSYAVIGRIADHVRVMSYDHAWAGSDAGPVAPLDWVRAVVAYAGDRIPPERLMLGIGTYGYDWGAGDGEYVPAADALALARRVGATPQWDPAAAAHRFGYTDDGERHTVWFEDARSLAAKQEVAVAAGWRGIFLWSLGGEDPDVWSTLLTATVEAAR